MATRSAAPDTTRARAVQVKRAPRSCPSYRAGAGGHGALWPSWSPRRFVPTRRSGTATYRARLDGARQRSCCSSFLRLGGRRERDDALDAAMRRAAARGVKVRLIVSDWET